MCIRDRWKPALFALRLFQHLYSNISQIKPMLCVIQMMLLLFSHSLSYKLAFLYFLCLHIIKYQCNEYYKCYRLWFLLLLIKQAIVTSFSNDIACFFISFFFSKCYVCYKCYNLYFRVVENFTHDHSQSLSLIHIWRCRRYAVCRSRWSPYH